VHNLPPKTGLGEISDSLLLRHFVGLQPILNKVILPQDFAGA